MKKFLSVVLTIIVILQASMMIAFAVGKDDVIWNPDGSKTILVSTEKFEAYKQSLVSEVEKCLQKYDDYHGKDSKKGLLLMLLPPLVIPLSISIAAFKIMKSYNRNTRVPISNGDNMPGKVYDKLSTFQTIMLGTLYGVSAFVGLLIANKFSPEHFAINCGELDLRNRSIYRQLTLEPGEDLIPGSSIDGILKYGARIECQEGNIGLCRAHSQLWCHNPNSNCYDSAMLKKERLITEK